MKSNSNLTSYIIIGLVVIGLIVLFALFYSPEKQYKWYTTYSHNQNQPYDFSLFKAIVKQSYDFQEIGEHGLAKKLSAIENPKEANYIFVGRYPYHSKADAAALYDFVAQGAVAFILSENVPDSILRTFVDEYDCRDAMLNRRRLGSIDEANIKVGFVHPNLRAANYAFSFKGGIEDTSSYFWGYIDNHYYEEAYCSGQNAFTKVGYFKNSDGYEYANFVRAKIGNGAIYWHSNPILFSNLYMSNATNEAGFDYVDKILAHGNGNKVIWDLASTMSPRPDDNERPPSNYEKPKTPMEYIFSQPALTWAWLLLIGLAVLYGLFGAKRRQRVIPIVETNHNTSLEFVKTIGRLYFQQQNHSIIFEKIMQLFLSHLRQRYAIVVRDMDEATIQRIVVRSDVPADTISAIFSSYTQLSNKLRDKEVEMSPETLNKFYLLVEKFYSAEEARKLLTEQK